MDDVKIDTSKTLTLTLPSDPDSNIVNVVLYHELGDIVQASTAATRASAGVYTIQYGQKVSGEYVLNAAGKYRADFTYAMSSTSYTQSRYFDVYTPYITWAEFVANHAELSSFQNKFDYFEKRARNIINTYCGQSFEYYPNKSYTIDGNNHKNLHLPIPVTTLRKVTINVGDSDEELLYDSNDATANNIEKVRHPLNFQTTYYLRFKSSVAMSNSNRITEKYFRENSDYKIEGDFGWRYVPTNVTQAADLIIADLMNDDSEYRRHGITSVDMDNIRFSMNSNFYESTGNIEADVLLTDYTLFVMDYIV